MEIRSIYPYSVGMRQNTDQKNSEHGHFSRSGILPKNTTAYYPLHQHVHIQTVLVSRKKTDSSHDPDKVK